MNPQAMQPFGQALLACQAGDTAATLLIRRDDGDEGRLPVAHFFRGPGEFSAIERAALALCAGRVLDIGAGAGSISLALQDQRFAVTAIDVCPQAVEVMARRGVADAACVDILDFHATGFDTLLLLGHGIGMVETLAGLGRLLNHAAALLAPAGRLLLDSLDVRNTDHPRHLAYHRANRQSGRYIGEVRMQFIYQDQPGPSCGWLHVDPDTLTEQAAAAGWCTDIVHRTADGDYLASLRPRGAG